MGLSLGRPPISEVILYLACVPVIKRTMSRFAYKDQTRDTALKTILKRTAVVLVALILLAAASALLVFKLVQDRVAARMKPPHLRLQPEPASELTYRTLDGTPQTLSSSKGQVVLPVTVRNRYGLKVRL